MIHKYENYVKIVRTFETGQMYEILYSAIWLLLDWMKMLTLALIYADILKAVVYHIVH